MAAAIKPRNGKREYTDEEVLTVLTMAELVSMPKLSKIRGIPLKTIKNWKYGPRGERVRGL